MADMFNPGNGNLAAKRLPTPAPVYLPPTTAAPKYTAANAPPLAEPGAILGGYGRGLASYLAANGAPAPGTGAPSPTAPAPPDASRTLPWLQKWQGGTVSIPDDLLAPPPPSANPFGMSWGRPLAHSDPSTAPAIDSAYRQSITTPTLADALAKSSAPSAPAPDSASIFDPSNALPGKLSMTAQDVADSITRARQLNGLPAMQGPRLAPTPAPSYAGPVPQPSAPAPFTVRYVGPAPTSAPAMPRMSDAMSEALQEYYRNGIPSDRSQFARLYTRLPGYEAQKLAEGFRTLYGATPREQALGAALSQSQSFFNSPSYVPGSTPGPQLASYIKYMLMLANQASAESAVGQNLYDKADPGLYDGGP